MASFAYITFRKDNKKSIVPISFIKDFDLGKWSTKTMYRVFRSNIEEDTPERMLERESKIPEYDNDCALQCASAPGYFYATVAVVEDSISAVKKSVEEKRIKKPTVKVIEVASDKKKNKQAPIVEPKGNSGPTKKGFSRKLKDETIRDLKKNIFNKGAKRALPSSSETDACSDDEDGYVCILKYRILQRKLRERERELEQCRRLNFHLQEKLIEAESRKQNQAYEIPTTSSMKISTTSNSATTPKKIEPVPSTSNSPPLSHVMEVEEELENMPPKENSQEMQPSMNTDNNNEGYCFYEGRILSADVMRDLQEMRKGPQGDSLFVKKVAVLAWGSEYLMRHSVSGRADPKRGNKAMSEKRPSLDKSRLEAVRNAELPKATNTSALSGAGVLRLFNKVGGTVNKMTYKMEENDLWFEEKVQEIESLESAVRELLSATEALVLHRRDLAAATGALARSAAVLSNCEEHTSLSRSLSQLADIEEKIEILHYEQANSDSALLCELMKDYVALIGAVKDVFHERVKVYQNWQHSQLTLTKKREAKAKLDLSGKTDKSSLAAEEVSEWEAKVERGQEEFNNISSMIKKEMEMFESQRVRDFKETLVKYLENLLGHQQQLIKFWEIFLPEAKAIA